MFITGRNARRGFLRDKVKGTSSLYLHRASDSLGKVVNDLSTAGTS